MAEEKLVSIAFVGDCGVGKSAFLHRHATGEFLLRHVPTVEAAETSLSFVTTAGKIHTKITEYPAGDSVVYSNHTAFVIMFDVTSPESYESVPKYYKSIIDTTPNAHVVLCGNKVDAKERKVVPNKIRFHMGRNIKYYDISAKSNYNFEKPFLYIIRKVRGDDMITFAET